MKTTKIILLVIALIAFVLIGAFVMYRIMSLSHLSDTITDPITVIGNQGEMIEVAPVKKPIFDPGSANIKVVTEVKKGDLSKLTSVPQDRGILSPDQAIVERKVDEKGNTTLTIWTPIRPELEDQRPDQIPSDWSPVNKLPVQEDTEPKRNSGGQIPSINPEDYYLEISDQVEDVESSQEPERLDHFSGQLDQGEEWYYVETKVTIPAQILPESRFKPAFIVSQDQGKITLEAGLAYELLRFEQRPKWMPQNVFDVAKRFSIDGFSSIYRMGVGVSGRVLWKAEFGVGATIEWTDYIKRRPNQKLGFEVVLYSSIQF